MGYEHEDNMRKKEYSDKNFNLDQENNKRINELKTKLKEEFDT